MPNFTVTLREAAADTGYSERHLRRLVTAGDLRAAKLRGRLMFDPADLEPLCAPQEVGESSQDRLVAQIVAAAPTLSEDRRARIAAALRGASAAAA